MITPNPKVVNLVVLVAFLTIVIGLLLMLHQPKCIGSGCSAPMTKLRVTIQSEDDKLPTFPFDGMVYNKFQQRRAETYGASVYHDI